MHKFFTTLLLTAAAAASAQAAAPADPFAEVVMRAQHVSGSVYMLEGAGGNIGVSVGPDGTLIIDDQFAPLADKIVAALKGLGGDRPKLILNTHFHSDHTGSNPTMGTTGTIISHDNVRVRLLSQPDFSRSGLPLVTFDDHLKVHFNDDTLELLHLPQGHTDGDSIVWFKNANVIHMGDHFFKDRYPFVDVASGGSIDGFIANVERVLAMLPDGVKIIPGHGALSTAADLANTIAMVKKTSTIVRQGLADGQPADDIAAELDLDYPTYGSGFISAARWVEIVQADAKR